MGDNENTIGDAFTPEARAELLAMYTGMAMQGLLSHGNVFGVGKRAVEQAEDTIAALEKFHADRAKLEQANAGSPQ